MQDILVHVLIYLNERNIKVLANTNLRLNYSIVKLYRDNNFWKSRVKAVLKLNQMKTDWYDLFEKIYNRKDDIVHNLGNVLLEASKDGDIILVNTLILAGINPSAYQNMIIIYASINGHLNVVNLLLKDPRVNPSDLHNLAIIGASEAGHLNVVDRLLEDPRVNPSDQDNRAIIDASEKGHLNVVDRLLKDPRVDPSSQDNRAIIWASENGHLNVIDRLLEDPRIKIKLLWQQVRLIV